MSWHEQEERETWDAIPRHDRADGADGFRLRDGRLLSEVLAPSEENASERAWIILRTSGMVLADLSPEELRAVANDVAADAHRRGVAL